MNTNQLALDFLTRALQMKKTVELGDHIQKIVAAEKLLESTVKEPTLTSLSNRHISYSSDEQRLHLRERIFEELITLERLDNDDDIKLGSGGILPKGGLSCSSQAYIIIGLPASGKSTIANKIADHYGACIIDSDYAKRKFPEFEIAQGASIVHDESSLVTNGGDRNFAEEPSVYEFMMTSMANMVIPKIGYDCKSICGIRDGLIAKGYSVSLVLVHVDRQKSTARALDRFIKTGRYVPLGLVFDVYSNDPTLTYYRVKDQDAWTTVGKVSTEGDKPFYISGSENNPLKMLYGADYEEAS